MKITDEMVEKLLGMFPNKEGETSDQVKSRIVATFQYVADMVTDEAARECYAVAKSHLINNEYFDDTGPELEAMSELIYALKGGER